MSHPYANGNGSQNRLMSDPFAALRTESLKFGIGRRSDPFWVHEWPSVVRSDDSDPCAYVLWQTDHDCSCYYVIAGGYVLML